MYNLLNDINNMRFNSFKYDPRYYAYNNESHSYDFIYNDNHTINTNELEYNKAITTLQNISKINNIKNTCIDSFLKQKKDIHINIHVIHKMANKENKKMKREDINYLEINKSEDIIAGKGAQAAKALIKLKSKNKKKDHYR